ncbi:MAG: DNA translocase FtsK [Oscillospiraceae bacterium]
MARKTKAQQKTGTAKRKKSSVKSYQVKEDFGDKIRTPLYHTIWAAICLFIALLSLIGFFNTEGWVVRILCVFIKGMVGYGYYIVPPALLMCAFLLLFHTEGRLGLRLFATMMIPVFFSAFLHVILCKHVPGMENGIVGALYHSGAVTISGGVLSGLIAVGLTMLFSIYASLPTIFILLIIFCFVAFHIPARRVFELIGAGIRSGKEHAAVRRAEREAREEDDEEEMPGGRFFKRPDWLKALPIFNRDDEDLELEEDGLFDSDSKIPAEQTEFPDTPVSYEMYTPTEEEFAEDVASVMYDPAVDDVPVTNDKPAEKMDRKDVTAMREEITSEIENAAEPQKYVYPALDLLNTGTAGAVDCKDEVNKNLARLDTTLKSFGVNASIKNVTRGPTVTRYDVELEAGVKLNKLTNLAGDLALSLGVASVRIAPIPNQVATVGIEVPNKMVSTVYLRDILESQAFQNAPSKLTFAIGEDIGGASVCGNIAKLPHMLIAGTTGSGKSVCMNSLILSLLYKSTPEEVRLIMIDPKMVELGAYNGIPHLYIPVVTDPKKAAGALQWAVVEMMKRYRYFSECGVRDLAGYNNHQRAAGGETMPQVVIVIDELADLMLVASKEVEESICRVAQMGRASGMHLVIATQRPSADVITGLMKANIPSRIAFAVSSSLESRIILDNSGAEKLIGCGDMLYAPIGSGKPRRIQGAFVSDEERERVIEFIKSSAVASYSDEIMEEIEKAVESKNHGGKAETHAADNQYDDLLYQAADVIFDTKQASVSMLQRKLKLGYSRAARLVDQLEEIGLVGPNEGSKPRQILMSRDEWMVIRCGGAPDEALPVEPTPMPEPVVGEADEEALPF